MKNKILIFLIIMLTQCLTSFHLISSLDNLKNKHSSMLQNNISERILGCRRRHGRRSGGYSSRNRSGRYSSRNRGGRYSSRNRSGRYSSRNRGGGYSSRNRDRGGYGGSHQTVHNHYYVTNNHTHLQGKFHKTQVVVVAGSNNVNAANLKKK